MLHVITPVKDSIERTLKTIDAVLASRTDKPFRYTVYNDYSLPENRTLLEQAAAERGFELINLEDVIKRPSPNYIIVLQMAQRAALADDADLLIVESDVVVAPDTIEKLTKAAQSAERCGEVAAVTVDGEGRVNYPYEFAARFGADATLRRTRHHLSFCCTLLTRALLGAFDFELLDGNKDWHDVTVSHRSLRCGLNNYLLCSSPVFHSPHGSRPHKLLKKSNPIKYYWIKLTQHKDRI